MEETILLEKIKSLPIDLQMELEAFIDKLLEASKAKKRPFGILKGKIQMDKDFDETPEDFLPYE
jgi:hypothetical protein